MITEENQDTVTVTTRPAVFQREILQSQAYMIYRLAMETPLEGDGNLNKYRLLMGVANMLYDIDNGKLVVTVTDPYDNLGVY